MGCSNFISIAGLSASSFLYKSSLGHRDYSTEGNWYRTVVVNSEGKYKMNSRYLGSKHTWCNNCACYGQFTQTANLSATSNYSNTVMWKLDKYGGVFIYGKQQGTYTKGDNSSYNGQEGCNSLTVSVQDSANGSTQCKTKLIMDSQGYWSAPYTCEKKCTSIQKSNNPTFIAGNVPFGTHEDRPTTDTNTDPCTPDPETYPFTRPGMTIEDDDTTLKRTFEDSYDNSFGNDNECYFYWGSTCGHNYSRKDTTKGKSKLSGKLTDSDAKSARIASNNFRLEEIYRTNQPQSGAPFYYRCGPGPDSCWSSEPSDGFVDGALIANYTEGTDATIILVPYVNPNGMKDLIVNGEKVTEFKGKMYFYEAPFSYDDYGEVYLGDWITSQCDCGKISIQGLLPVLEKPLQGSIDGKKNQAGFTASGVQAGEYVIGTEIRVDSSMFSRDKLIFACVKDTTLEGLS